MKFIETLSYKKIIDLMFEAKKHLLISLPSIDEEIAEALILRIKEVEIKVIIDNSEESIRNGFGEVKAIEKIRGAGIKLKQCSGNLVSFIIADDIGFFIFPQSRIFSDILEDPKGANAVRIDPVTIQLLILNYFSSEQITEEIISDKHEAISESINHFEKVLSELKQEGVNISSEDFNENRFQELKKRLELNPPLEPDLQRKINTYTAKIQFVELKFSGGNLENRIAQLPKKAIPINSEELKNLLLTRIKMFQDLSKNPDYKKFQDFKDKVDKLRKDFLTPITCRQGKSIIKVEQKEKFKSELDKLKNEATTLNTVLTEMLEEGKMNTTDLLRNELKVFLKSNEPEELKLIQKEELKQRKLNDIINTIVVSIKFPDVKKLIEKISLNELYYDLTWNDFKEEKLLKEFFEKDIMKQDDIHSIVDLKKAFDVRK